MVDEAKEFITEEVEYVLIDTKRHVILGIFKTKEGAEQFLINNPIYRLPEVKIMPTLTFRDVGSLDYIMTCMSKIYDLDKKRFFDNEVINKIAEDFVEKIDVIRSDRSVISYID